MDLFKTKMTAVDDSKVTTCEKSYVGWRAGLKFSGESYRGRHNKTFLGKKHSVESREKMRMIKLEKHHARKALMTPNGLYPSRGDVARAAGVHSSTVDRWMKNWPEHYYYIKDAK